MKQGGGGGGGGERSGGQVTEKVQKKMQSKSN